MSRCIRICFVDSRYKTVLFDSVAKVLINQKKFEVSWIVQNRVFSPKNGNVNLIKYPSNQERVEYRDTVPNDILLRVAQSDRMVKYFNGSITHYGYYWSRINDILEEIQPDIVIGEPGNFHTHLTVYACKSKGILFLDPETARYPTSRFRFHFGDQLDFLEMGDGEKSASDELVHLVERKKLPDYMRPISQKRSALARLVWAQWIVFYSRLLGDKYTVPSLRSFLATKIAAGKARVAWEKLSSSDMHRISGKKILLYPLQMQPEFNLDVWGYKYNNQAELIVDILKYLPDDWHLVIKPNPKSKLEMTKALLRATSDARVTRLSHMTSMEEVLPLVDNVITVTGTIGIERVLAEKPVITLGHASCYLRGKCARLEKMEHLPSVLLGYDEGEGMSGEEYLNYLYSNSFSGMIAEPIINNEPIKDENIEKIVRGISIATKDLIS